MRRFVIGVGIAHIALLIGLTLYKTPSLRPKASTSVVVQTVRLSPPPRKVVAAAPKPAATQKKETPKPVAAKKEAPKPAKKAPAKKPVINVKKQELIAKAQKSLSKVESISKPVLKAKPEVETVSETLPEMSLPAYPQELSDRLALMLSFPDYGAVKVKLTLTRAGNVAKLEVVHAASGENAEYVKAALSTASFPAFGSDYPGEKEHTFTLTLTGL